MNFVKLDIPAYKEKTKEWVKLNAEYTKGIVAINKAEHEEIERVYNGDDDVYFNDHRDRVEYYENQREALLEKYGEYSSYHFCPYYCVVSNREELDELLSERQKNNEHSNYYYWLRDLDFVGKDLQDECHKDVHGKCLGLAFFIDQDYYLIVDEKTQKEKFCLCTCPYEEIANELSYKIVTNGKDYI